MKSSMTSTATFPASLLSSSPFCCSLTNTNNMVNGTIQMRTTTMPLSSSRALSISRSVTTTRPTRSSSISIGIGCEVAFKPSASAAVQVNDLSSSTTSSQSTSSEDEVVDNDLAKVGARVRVKVPLKVYHVPKVPELDLAGMEGQIKQFVGLWNGNRISANLPYKVEFVTEIQGRGPVKFFAHLKEDEFEYV